LPHECDAYCCNADEMREPETSPLPKQTKAGCEEVVPGDTRLGIGHKVAKVEASPCMGLDIVGSAVSPPVAEGVARGQICGLLIQRLEDVSLFHVVLFCSYKSININLIVYFSQALSL
jgi:hypothetical protein